MKIVWRPRAILTYQEVIKFILIKRTQKEVNYFIDQSEKTIAFIRQNLYLYQVFDKKRNIHKAVINNHVSLFYQSNNSEVSLLVFWANKKVPQKMNI